MLEEGARPESNDNDNGQTLLLWAAKKGHEAVVELLLKETELESKVLCTANAVNLQIKAFPSPKKIHPQLMWVLRNFGEHYSIKSTRLLPIS